MWVGTRTRRFQEIASAREMRSNLSKRTRLERLISGVKRPGGNGRMTDKEFESSVGFQPCVSSE